jgi:hypothetical protein
MNPQTLFLINCMDGFMGGLIEYFVQQGHFNPDNP